MKGLIFNMNRFKRAGLVICIISLLISFVGCDMVKVDPEKDRARVVAKVDDDEILKGDFLDLYDQYRGLYGITDEIEENPEYEETVDQVKKAVLDQLIMEKIIYNKAIAAGYKVDDGVISDVKKQIIDELEESFKLADENAEQDAEELVREQLDEYIEASGMTEDEFWEKAAEQEQVEKFIEEQLGDIEATETEIQKFYDEQLQEQRENPEVAENAQIMLHLPEGYRRVKHILIELPEADREEHAKLVAEEKDKEADNFLEEKLKDIQPKAKEILERAKSGEDFEKLVAEYSFDKGMDIEQGYTLNEDTNFVESFKEAAFNLKKEGDISELVPSDYGYHIIKLYDLPGKEYTLEEKKDLIKEMVEYEKKNEKWASIMEEWEEQAQIKKYERRL